MMRPLALAATLLLVLSTALLWGIRAAEPEQLMRLLSRQAAAGGLQLRHSGLRWHWRGYSPQLQLQQLQLDGPGLQMELEGLDGGLDLWRSLWHRALVWRHLQLQSLDLQIAPQPSAAGGRGGISPAARRQLRALVEHSRLVHGGRLALSWRMQNAEQLRYELSDLWLDNRRPTRHWHARMRLGDGEGLFAARLQGGGARLRGRAHLRLAATLPPLPGLGVAASGSTELWMERVDGPWQLYGQLRGRAGEHSLDARLLGDWQSGIGQLSLLGMNGTLAGGPLPLAALRLDGGTDGWRLSGAPLDLAAASAPLFGLVPMLAELKPRGTLSRWQLQLADGWQLRGQLADAAAEAARGIPQVRGLSGVLAAGPHGGRLALDASDLSIWYRGTYDKPLHHRHISGLMRWQLADGQLELSGQGLRIDDPGAQITGGFRLHTPLRAAGDGLSRLDLHLGVRQLDAARWRDLTPRPRVPPALWKWLSGSVEAGRVPQAAFIWRGSLRRGQGPHASTLQLALDVRDARLRWHPDWPSVEQLGAIMRLSDNHIRARADARLWGTEWRDMQVQLSPIEGTKTMQLDLQGQGLGPAADLLDALRRTPLRARIGSGLDGWNAEGTAQTGLQLRLPLLARVGADDMAVAVHSKLQGVSLQSGILDAADLSGELHYNNRMEGIQGLRSEGLAGMFWGSPVRARLWQPSARHLRLDVDGILSIEEAAARLPLAVLGGSGSSEYSAQMNWVQGGDDGGYAMMVQTDLEGIAMRPPAAMLAMLGREADEPGELVLRASQRHGERHMQMQLQYGELVRARMRLADGGLQGMGLGLLVPPPEPEDGILWVRTAAMAEVDLDRDLEPLLAAFGGGAGGAGGPRPRIDLDIKQLRYMGRDWPDVQGRVELRDDGWNIDVESPQVAGNFGIAAGKPLRLHFRHIKLSQQTVGGGPGDLSPSALPAAMVRMDHLVLQGRDLGGWCFEVRPQADGSLRVADIYSSQLAGHHGDAQRPQFCEKMGGSRDFGSSLGTIHWQRHGDAHQSRIDFDLSGGDIAALLSRLAGLDEFITSRRFRFVGHLSWPGPPSVIRAGELSGNIEFQMVTGSIDSQLLNSNNLFFKLLGIFNIYRWTKRLRLQVSDLMSGDASYSEFNGRLEIDRGVVRTIGGPIRAHLATGQLRVEGIYDIHHQNLDAQLAMFLPVQKNLAWFVGILVSLPAAIGTWLAERLLFTRLDKSIDQLVSVNYTVKGDIDNLQVQRQRPGDVKDSDTEENSQ